MCGIAVILPGAAAAPLGAIERMVAALRHRGPDGEGIQRAPGCDLGHTRLAILDPAGGAQPMTDDTGRWSIVFNGEIFNHADLRNELTARGHRFHTRCDTESLLRGFIEWGDGVCPRLNGQFAFAVWDRRDRRLFAARDRFGEKPLFFARCPRGQWLIASEIKAILATGMIDPRLDPLSVDAYVALFYVPPDRTIYRDVHVLPPGCAMTFADGAASAPHRWWTPAIGARRIGADDAVAEIRRLTSAAVDRQWVADVPVGCFLSGGLDSTTLVGLAASDAGRRIQTYAVGFGDLIDELPFARAAADLYRTDHRELQATIDPAPMLQRMIEVYDEPFGDSSNIPAFQIAAFARDHVKVALGGDGADELFGGYSWYSPPLSVPPADGWNAHTARATHLHFDRSALWSPRPAPPTLVAIRDAFDAPRLPSALDHATHFDATCYLPGDILVKIDRAAMAHGLETRSPFLDADLAEFALSLPASLRFADPQLKGLMRRAFSDLWPEPIRRRGKQGFGAPVGAWLKTPEVDAMWRRVRRTDGPLVALLPGLPSIIPALRPQRTWVFLCLGLWLERHPTCLRDLP